MLDNLCIMVKTQERVHDRTYFLNTALGELPFNGLCTEFAVHMPPQRIG